MPDIVIREFRPEDLELLYILIQDSINVSYKDVYPEGAVQRFKAQYTRENLRTDTTQFFVVVAEQDDAIIGTGALHETHLRGVYINPRYQRTGVGRLIVNELEKKARDNNVSRLELGASLPSLNFWLSAGYTMDKEDFVTLESGEALHFYRMSKSLTA